MEVDLVVLVDAEGRPIGTAPRASVHTDRTPLHLAFSCHIADERGRILLTRRALAKPTWPGVWTNAFCGHPRPGESFEDAVARRAVDELGTEVVGIAPLLPDFRYRAVDASGTVEHEICPVFTARLAGAPSPAPEEVADWAWVEPDALRAIATNAPFLLSPWLVAQLAQLGRGVG